MVLPPNSNVSAGQRPGVNGSLLQKTIDLIILDPRIQRTEWDVGLCGE